MNKSIETIWKEGLMNHQLAIPKINNLYNQKSISTVEMIIKGFKKEIILLIPLAILVFLFNILLDNDNAVFWGIISALPCFVWVFIGYQQLKSIEKIDYKANSYQYLTSIKNKLEVINKFNKRLAISSVPIILFPMLLYTYFNQEGKTIGEIFGVDGFNYPTITIFLLLPVFTLAIYFLAQVFFKKGTYKRTKAINNLLSEMEELR